VRSSDRIHVIASGSSDSLLSLSSFSNRLFGNTAEFSASSSNRQLLSLSPYSPQCKQAFTLVELLVCITVIAALAGLIFAVMGNLKRSAENVVAVQRIRGLGQANAAYAVENNGKYVPIFAFSEDRSFLPPWFYNTKFLETLIGEATFLNNPEQYEGSDGYPEMVLDPVVVRSKKRFWSRLHASFGYNQENMPGGDWGQAGTSRSHTTSSVAFPNQTFQFITATDWTAKYSGRNLWKSSPVEGRTPDGKMAFRHKGGTALAVFYDGHAEAISPEDIKRFDARGGIDHVFWGGNRQ
jgi:prepilin-type N-terminal cleavage/methylation domain-containing protein